MAGYARSFLRAAGRLLEARAVSDVSEYPRSKALELLADRENWRESWQRAIGGVKSQVTTAVTVELRGWSARTWLGCGSRPDRAGPDGLAEVKRQIFTEVADGEAPYLDSFEAVSEAHLKEVWENAGRSLSDADFERMIAEINADLGWDIR